MSAGDEGRDVISHFDADAYLVTLFGLSREGFLTVLLATWAAIDRGDPAAEPTVEEMRRAAAGARAALGEILR